MSKSNATEADLVAYIFNATAIPWNADTTFYIALHTADPGEAGTQSTNEVAYTSYARVLLDRNNTAFTVAGANAVNAALIQFPTCTGSTATATHWSIGLDAAGAGQILYSGALTASLAISNTITPQFAASALSITED